MSKLAGHLLQTTPIVLAASLAAQQGVNASPVPPAINAEVAIAPPSAVVVPASQPMAATATSVPVAPPPAVVAPAPPAAPEPVAIAVAKTPKPLVPQAIEFAPAPVSPPTPAASPVEVAAVPEPRVAPAAPPTPQPLRSEFFEELDTGELLAPTVAQPAIIPEAAPPAVPLSEAVTITVVDAPETSSQSLLPEANETAGQAAQWQTVQQETALPTAPVDGELMGGEFVDLDAAIADLEAHPEQAEGVPVVPEATIVEDFVDIDPAIAHLEELPLEAFDELIIAIEQEDQASDAEQELEQNRALGQELESPTPSLPTAPTPTAQLSQIPLEVTPASIVPADSPVGNSSVEEQADDEFLDLDEFVDLDAASADWHPLSPQAIEALDELERQGAALAPELSVDEVLEQVAAYSTGTQNLGLPSPSLEPPRELELESAEPEQAADLSVAELLDQANAYSAEGMNGSLGQGAFSAARFSDVSPADWAYTALDDLVRRYDCLQGYPNGTFRGSRSLSRYEFAAGLNACVQQVERLIAETTTDLATRADLEVLGALVREFETEIDTLNNRVDGMEERVTFLEDHQFSTTTKLAGEVLFALTDQFTESQLFDDNYDGVLNSSDSTFSGVETVFQNRVRLNLLTSFNGRDRLHTRLQSRNASQFEAFNGQVTNEGRWAFAGSSASTAVSIADLSYRTPLSRQLDVQIAAVGLSADDIAKPLSPFDGSGSGSLSQFGQQNPIYRAGDNDAGIGFNFKPSDALQVTVGYTNETAASASSGVFNDGYNFISQATIKPSEQVAIAAVFSHAYGTNGQGLSFGAGSRGANLAPAGSRGVNNTGRPVVGNSYALEALVNLNEQLFVGGWVGYTWARVINVGDADIWNYAGFLGVNDLGGEGNQLGLIVGMEPRLTRADTGVGAADRSTGLHIEGFYKIRVNDNVDITPGVIWLTEPDHNSTNPDLVAGVVRTRFKF